MFVDRPQASVPIPEKKIAVCIAPRRPKILQSRPYRGVNVHVARRYLKEKRKLVSIIHNLVHLLALRCA